MIVWLNGAFGAGKTTVAYELAHRVPGSFVCDPEQLGFGLRRMLPRDRRGDFQDLPLWRQATVSHLLGVERGHESGPVIVPMTIVDPLVFDEVVGTLRSGGVTLVHCTLVVSPAVLRRRLRFGRLGLSTWALNQVDRCTAALRDQRFAVHLQTDGRSIDSVVAEVAAEAGLALRRDRGCPARSRARRLAVQARHIRLD